MKKIILVPLCSTIFILAFGVLTTSAAENDSYLSCFGRNDSDILDTPECEPVKKCKRIEMACVRTCRSTWNYDADHPENKEGSNKCLNKCLRNADACVKQVVIEEPEDVEDNQIQDKEIITIGSITGEVKIMRNGQWIKAKKGMEINNDDLVAVGAVSKAIIRLGKTKVVLKEATQISVSRLVSPTAIRTLLRMRTGKIEAKVHREAGIESDFKAFTPTSVTSVRGTTFQVRYIEKTGVTDVYVEEGEVSVTDNNGQGEVIVQANQHTSVSKGRLPQKPISSSKIENPWWESGSDLSDISAYINLALILIGIAFAVFVLKKLIRKKIIIKMLLAVGMVFVILIVIGFMSV